jgi:hypothetical protein
MKLMIPLRAMTGAGPQNTVSPRQSSECSTCCSIHRFLTLFNQPFGFSPGSSNWIRRIEGGVLDYGADILPINNPYEPGMASLVNIGKYNFIGKSVLQAIRDNGTSQIMKGVYFET